MLSNYFLTEHSDIPAAKRFFTGAVKKHGAPEKIMLDDYPATHSAITEWKASGFLPLPHRLSPGKLGRDVSGQQRECG
jgi:transposase-like protein